MITDTAITCRAMPQYIQKPGLLGALESWTCVACCDVDGTETSVLIPIQHIVKAHSHTGKLDMSSML